ncbi:type II toxin-antitoxin system VapB family antitoxin [Arthrobacter pigmenti]
MGMNIKNERVHSLAREAAQRTGRSQTSVLELALEKLLAELEDQDGSDADRRYRETMKLADYCTALMNDSDRALTTDDLYDENGLPA